MMGSLGDSSTSIPLIDLSPFTDINSSPSSRLKAAQDLVEACHTTGFAYLTNYSISPSQISGAFSWAQKFHALPDDKKALAARPADSTAFRGWSKVGLQDTSAFDPSNKKGVIDFSETYDSGSDQHPEDKNVWLPEEALPGFKAAVQSFQVEAWKTAELVLKALEMGLGLDEGVLQKVHGKEYVQLGVRHYPAVNENAVRTGGARRLGAHTDFDTFTLLWQDSVGGLEVLVGEQWTAIKAIEGAVVMNIGDVLQRWTNDYLRSTKHRVHLPSDAEGFDGSAESRMTKERYSIPFFVAPLLDEVMSPLDIKCGEKVENKFEPMTFRQYVTQQTEKTYGKDKSYEQSIA